MAQQSSANATVSVVFAANDYYVPYLSTLFASILEHCSSTRAYEFIILSKDITDSHRASLEAQLAEKGVQLRMIDVTNAMRPYEEMLVVHSHFKLETYFRLLLPQLLPNHHKVLYLDSDMVCLHDIAQLYDTDVEDYLVAACKDPDTTGIYSGIERDVAQPNKRAYVDNVLGIKNPYDYFQAGTVLFNLDAWRDSIDTVEMFRFAQTTRLQLLDQDVLNVFCQGRVKFVDIAWNVMYDLGGWRIRDIISHTTPELYDAYMAARKNPYIVHYAGPIKPWSDPEADFAAHFWRYARITPFYEMIIRRLYYAPLRSDIERITKELADTRAWIGAIDSELRRYEDRSAGLMLKEFLYQKVFTPLVGKFTANNPEAKDKVYSAYRKVHPHAEK